MGETTSNITPGACAEPPKGGQADRNAREQARLAAELKANLYRRKQQARSRAAAQEEAARPDPGGPHESAGFAADKPLPGSEGRGD